ncbi:YdcF family protein [Bacillus sp. AGMB 02131]|uniref:YdcF family protein n=1 Tax=Peribacillus faecalis TaxID=2772559 RepID=A0A927CZI3_9BACI|nr:YdcF family protein [Peribacillus faecalis]MBD3109886.1 YdcF family protein [Peribacillus faecalis]
MVKYIKMLFIVVFCFLLHTGLSVYAFSLENDEDQSDAAIVLGAAAWNGKPSPVLKERINHAIELYEEGKVGYIIFTGGTAEGEVKSEALTSKEYAVEQGVNENHIIIEEKSMFTKENIEYALEAVQQQGYDFDSYMLVSDPLHMKRSVYLAEEFNITVHSSPTQTSAFQSVETKLPFFMKEWVYYTGYILTSPFR